MSKAFVKDDVATETPMIQHKALTDPSENYITSQGVEMLKRELRHASPERVQELRQLIASAQVIVPESQTGERALFGATVTVVGEDGHDRIYKLVGVDETDIKSGKVSWISPIGKTLLGARAGDVVIWRTPRGDEELEIKKVEFAPIR